MAPIVSFSHEELSSASTIHTLSDFRLHIIEPGPEDSQPMYGSKTYITLYRSRYGWSPIDKENLDLKSSPGTAISTLSIPFPLGTTLKFWIRVIIVI